jgi:hypothetical protein
MPYVNAHFAINDPRRVIVSTIKPGLITCWIILTYASNSQHASYLTQRRVNDYSAALERCRRSILVSPGLRGQIEPLPAYISRVSARLPGEDTYHYQIRVRSYIAAIEAAAESTASARMLPTLKNNSVANLSLWRRAVRDLGYLPKRIVQVRSAEQSAIHDPGASTAKSLASELLITIQLILDAYSNLRDARP